MQPYYMTLISDRLICPSLILLYTKIKLKYQPEEKEIDFVEELELYS